MGDQFRFATIPAARRLVGVVGLWALTSSTVLVAQDFPIQDGMVYMACSGHLYDSGGADGPYQNDEDITTTLCPQGGPGSGSATTVRFTAWALAAGAGDTLRIYDGPSATGVPLAVGTASNPLLGQTFTASLPEGCLTFHFVSNATATAAGWAAEILTGPNAGENGDLLTCSNGGVVNLFTLLGGTPDGGGAWYNPFGNPHTGSYNPATQPGGDYAYVVSTPGCPDDTAWVNVTRVLAPNAGTNGSVTVCANDAAFALINVLGGAPAAGGTWMGPGNVPHNGIFVPGVNEPGPYVYTVTGTLPCANAQATVTVSVSPPPDAGEDATIDVCSTDVAFDLFDLLGGAPQPGGVWTGPGGLPVSSTFNPASSPAGPYTYTVAGTPPCAPAQATVTVNVVPAAQAGSNASLTACGNDVPFAMFDQLGGTPQAGGEWTGPNGPHGGMFDPATDDPGAYVYTVQGDAPCPAVSATLTIAVSTPPNAGLSGDTLVCSSDASFPLFAVLNGSPWPGGSWTFGGLAHTGIFEPGVSTPGVYTYTVLGPPPCAPAVATVTVAVTTAPVAGLNNTVTLCSNDDPVDLFSALGGTPDMGGTWTGPAGVHNGTFLPGTDLAGAYLYTVVGATPCPNASAIVTTVVVPAPNPGTDGSITVCSNDGPVNLFGELGGNPDGNGSWFDPDNMPHGTTYLPGVHTPGVYRYVVPGIGPCLALESTVTVAEVTAPNPGTNGSITVCSNDEPVDLFDLLGGDPDGGGTWTRPNGLPHTGTYLPGFQPGGTYTYTVAGTLPCADLSAAVQVVRVIAPRAGTDGSTVVCSSNGPFALVGMLGGNPDGNGSWYQMNDPVPALFTPGTSTPGEYMYVVPGTFPCANDTSFVTVTVNIAPVAGSNASITVCSADAAFDLFGVLGGTPDAGGTWRDPLLQAHNGTFLPGTDPAGGYTYTVVGEAPCNNASAVVVVNVREQRSAGTDATLERCTTDPPVNLFSLLGGTPATGGVWEGPGPVPGGFFNPATDAPGAYNYIVTSEAPCVNDTATVTAVVHLAPYAGESAEITICSVQEELDLFEVLGGTPDLNGTWTEVETAGQLSGSIFSTLGLPPGTYHFQYTVPGIGVCGDDVATVTVTTVPGLDAGDNGVLTVCRNNTQVNLFNGLGGTPQTGGVWIDLSGTNALSGQYFNAMQVAPGSYNFRYRLTGALACTSDSALVTVSVVDHPDPGVPSSMTVCSDGASFNMFTFLGGQPDAGGQWRQGSIGGPLVSNVYNPAVHTPDTFYYIVSGNGPCADSAAWLVVNEALAPNPGLSSSTTVCANGASFNMTTALGGTPDAGGQWYYNSDLVGATFVPGQNSPGTYTYRLLGPPACGFRESQLTVNVQPAINAGNNTTVTVCSNSPAFNLFNLLGGGAQFGGHWTDPDNAAHTGQFNPAVDQEGTYTYILPDSAACLGDQATVSVFVNQRANAGIGGVVQLCSVPGTSLNLFSVLGGNPDPVGTWVGPLPQQDPVSGIFVVGVTPPGTYRYRVAGAWPCTADSADVSVQLFPQSSAGISRSIQVCNNASAFAMVDSLGGFPANGGVWHGPGPAGPPMNGLFFPGTTAPGTYYYTVNSPNCPSSTASLQVLVSPAPFAGNDTSITVCDNEAAFDLSPLLGPGAQSGGSWYDPNGVLHTGTIHPATSISGPYKYKITGQWPCAADSAIVQVTINRQPMAGCNALTVVCSNSLPFQLHDLLGCGPDAVGQWTTPGPMPMPHSGTFIPGQDAPGAYTFTVAGPPGCASASATVNVVVNNAVTAGNGGTQVVCSDAAPFLLHEVLTGETPGGTWYDPNGVITSFEFIPGESLPGDYKYKVTGLAPCPADSSIVTVVEVPGVNAGISTQAYFCTTDGLVPLIDLLGGQPTPGGIWVGPLGPHGPNFDPSIDTTGSYVYTVDAVPPCADRTAQVYIINTPAPHPGMPGSITVCVGSEEVDLWALLGDSYDTGGQWSDDDGTGQMEGGVLSATSLPPSQYQFTYTVEGDGVCTDASTTVTVVITEGLNPGEDSIVNACLGELVDLFGALGGTPQPGGFWTGSGSFALVGGVFNTALVSGGTSWDFHYTLPGSSLCPSATAKVTVNVVAGPYAGCDADVDLCSTGGPVQLLDLLDCGPQTTGSWFDESFGPHTGVFDPAQDAPGVFHYVVPAVGNCPADSARLNIIVTVAPNAGTDGTLTVCSDQDPVDMFTLLGPNAQPGGNWYKVPNTPHSGTYDPAVDTQGSFRYEVAGQSPCPTQAIAFVTIVENQAPHAGCDTEISLCSTNAIINMRLSLDCSAPQGGSWFGPGMVPWPNNLFDPASHAPGDYTHVMPGIAPCLNDTAVLSISVTPQANPGQNATANACLSQTELDLWPLLGPQAQTGGTWTDLGNSGALTASIFNPQQAGGGTWSFQYGFPTNGPCPAVSSTVVVEVDSGVNPGLDAAIEICGAETAFDLITGLGGTPDLGGAWAPITGGGEALDPDGTLNATMLTPGVVIPYRYTVSDPNCGELNAVLTVTISPYPDPGFGPDGEIVLCTTSDPLELFPLLMGTPNDTGSWTTPQGLPHNGILQPGSDPAGVYTYTVAGNTVCPDSAAYVTVVLNQPPDAGVDAHVQVCDTLTALDLFAQLGGSPQNGGHWLDVTGSGGLQGGLLNTTGLQPGVHLYDHVVGVQGCPADTARLAVTVVGQVSVVDLERICNEQDRTYTVRFTIVDGDPSTYSVTGLEGDLSTEAPYVFTSAVLFTSQSFSAWVQDANACGQVLVEGATPCDFEVEVFIPQSFSPNGDNINDTFVIPGIEGYPLNRITIFNRWGAEIYSAEGYDNHSVVWDGTSTNALFGGDVPTGTYFYILELAPGTEPFTGYVQLVR
jgi:gliding motility-associated-like protein